ncbi:MAG TPA: aminotransferase class V-fold PLP-dependent enzyme [Devosiaceae bacterium]|jgi:aspartate aminotransferase-like enzyme|nr:aminotransferase class V-fold PLP-dependent enzyme [Devosiaceae bacterium]
MLPPPFNPLLSVPAFPANRYAPLADRLKRLLSTESDVVFVQAEAILALEAAATSLARQGLVALNIITSPYGGYFGGWLRRGGANVTEVAAEPGRPISIEAVRTALNAMPRVDLVAMVHAETSSGILNPLPEIAALVKERGALLVVDAVASFGGHPLDVDGLGIDVCVIGPQKALGGPAGLSIVSISERAWEAMAGAERFSPSSLSLLDIKANWLDRGRGAASGMPSALEFWALEAAVDRLEAEGLSNRTGRHALAAQASRAALKAMGIALWVENEAQASTLMTATPVPAGIDPAALIALGADLGVAFTPGNGEIRGTLLRLDHTGDRAAFSPVVANVVAYGAALRRLGHAVDIGAGAAAAAEVYTAKR